MVLQNYINKRSGELFWQHVNLMKKTKSIIIKNKGYLSLNRARLYRKLSIQLLELQEVLYIEGILLDRYNILKTLQKMSFYIFPNNQMVHYGSFQQMPGFYSSLNTFYQTSDDFYNPSTLTYSIILNENLPNFDQKQICTVSTIEQFPKKTTLNPVSKNQRSKRKNEKTLEKQISSAKKNSQSNIINQFYSFFSSREKSQKVVEKSSILMGKTKQQIQKIIPIFFTAIRLINMKRGRKYVNVAMFMKFFNSQQLGQYVTQIKDKIYESQVLNLDELCQIFRRCAKYYLKQISIPSILTSKRISLVSKQQHLKKSRKILRNILGN